MAESSSNSKTILIIEDDADIRDSLLQALELEGYQVLGAENGREGLKVLEDGARPNLILLDLMMPIMSGWQFYEAIQGKPEFKSIPIVVISAVGSKADEMPAQAVLRKPVDLESLIKVVDQHIS